MNPTKSKVLALLVACTSGLARPATPAAAQAPSLAYVGQFGCSDCVGPLLFERVEALTISPAGTIVVVDRGEPRVRIFERDGKVVSAFGRSGAGPAEVGNASAVTTTAGGDLLVIDAGQGRVLRTSATGADRGTTRLGGFATAADFDPTGAHSLIAITSPRDSALRLVRPTGSTIDEVGRFGASLFPQRDGNWEALPFAVAADGSFAVGDGRAAYVIHTFTPTGGRAGSITRQIARRPLTDAEVAAEQEAQGTRAAQMAARLGGRATPPPAAPVQKEHDHFGADALEYDGEGRLWVRVDRALPSSTTFDVFGPDRRYLGEVTVNAKIRDYEVGAGLLAGVVLDALDVERIGIWRVTTPRE